MADVSKLLTNPPKALVYPQRAQRKQQRSLQLDIDQLTKKIDRATENLLLVDDARTRQALDKRVTAMRDERASLQAKLAAVPEPAKGMDTDGLHAWWHEYERTALRLPIPPGKSTEQILAKHPGAVFYRDPEEEEQLVLMIDPKRFNETLYALGCEVRLRWRTTQQTLANRASRDHHQLFRVRFRLGQKTREIPVKGFVKLV